MGGNALKECGTVRLNRIEAECIGFTVQDLIRRKFRGAKTKTVRSYYNKQEYGDIDIVVESGIIEHEYYRVVYELQEFYGGSIPYIKNGPVLSVAVPCSTGRFQVDLIGTDLDHFDFACQYYDWNDLGNLIGRVAHKHGLKFGHNGLSLVLREGNHLLGEITLTTDFERALEYFDFNPTDHYNGFDGEVDIFNYVTASKFFNPDIYKLENRNHTARVRDRKRKTYMDFLAHIKDLDGHDYFQYTDDKEVYVRRAVEWFNKEKDRAEMLKEHGTSKKAKQVFNGSIVSDVTGLQGKELGWAMQSLKSQFPFNDKDALVLWSESEVRKIIEFLLYKR